MQLACKLAMPNMQSGLMHDRMTLQFFNLLLFSASIAAAATAAVACWSKLQCSHVH